MRCNNAKSPRRRTGFAPLHRYGLSSGRSLPTYARNTRRLHLSFSPPGVKAVMMQSVRDFMSRSAGPENSAASKCRGIPHFNHNVPIAKIDRSCLGLVLWASTVPDLEAILGADFVYLRGNVLSTNVPEVFPWAALGACPARCTALPQVWP